MKMRDKILLKILALACALVMVISCATPCIAVDNQSQDNASNPFGDIFTSENTTTNTTPFSLSANTIYVPDDYSTIQQAVDDASAGDTIIVRDGTYTENVDVNKELPNCNYSKVIVPAVVAYAIQVGASTLPIKELPVSRLPINLHSLTGLPGFVESSGNKITSAFGSFRVLNMPESTQKLPAVAAGE